MRHGPALALAASLLLLVPFAPRAACAGAGEDAAPAAFLVRHAEKDAAGGDDPPLSEAGAARARRLADLLADQPVARVYVTDTRRARDTAAPLAERRGLPVELYDPRRLADLAVLLRERRETALVVGHSNTTDELAVALGGESSGPMPESEYDRLYRVDLGDGSTFVRRF